MHFLALCLMFAGAMTAAHEEWARFRGPNGSGVSPIESLPTTWTTTDFAWKTPLPGRGHSSPVVWGNRVFVTAADARGDRIVVCVGADRGEVLWRKQFAAVPYKAHKRNSIATATPALDARHVYLLWGTPRETIVQALDHDGTEVWKVDLGPFRSQHGLGVSPVLFEDLLLLALDQDEKGRLIALDTGTGTQRWELPRKSGNATYSTPCVYRRPGQPAELIFTNWQHGITAIEPRTGRVVWESSVFEPSTPERAIVSPLIVGDLVVGTCGFVTGQKHLVAVRPTAAGKVEEIWRLEKQVPHLPTPLALGGHVYMVTEKGIASCLESATGRVVWEQRLDNEFSASPVSAGGMIYLVANDGEVFVLRAGPTFELVARNQLGHATQATPALAGRQIIFRTEQHLLALRASGK